MYMYMERWDNNKRQQPVAKAALAQYLALKVQGPAMMGALQHGNN